MEIGHPVPFRNGELRVAGGPDPILRIRWDRTCPTVMAMLVGHRPTTADIELRALRGRHRAMDHCAAGVRPRAPAHGSSRPARREPHRLGSVRFPAPVARAVRRARRVPSHRRRPPALPCAGVAHVGRALRGRQRDPGQRPCAHARRRVDHRFPGGAREVFKRRGEKYALIGERTGFARLAIECGYPIVPFSAVGAEDVYDIVLDAEDTTLLAAWAASAAVGAAVRRHSVVVRGVGPRPFREPSGSTSTLASRWRPDISLGVNGTLGPASQSGNRCAQRSRRESCVLLLERSGLDGVLL